MSGRKLLKWLTGASVVGTIVGGVVIVKDRATRIVSYDAKREKKLYGHTVIITGATNGIGKACAEELALRGAKLILPAKYVDKCEKVAKDIRDRTANMQVFCEKCDLADLDSVRRFVDKMKREQRRVDVLINNAAYFGPKSTRQVGLQNIEMHMTVNFLAPYLLTNLLLSRSDSSPVSYDFANELKVQSVINLVCDVKHFLKLAKGGAEKQFSLDFRDFNYELAPYDSAVAYSKSKLALMMWTQSLADTMQQRHNRQKSSSSSSRSLPRVVAVDPGVVRSELLRNAGYRKNIVSYGIVSLFERITLRKPDDCLATIMYAIFESQTSSSQVDRASVAATEKKSDQTEHTLSINALRNPSEFSPITSLVPSDLTVNADMLKQLELTAISWTGLQNALER